MSLPLRETSGWIRDTLGSEPHRILEVGSGGGGLALELMSQGHHVVALDSSEEAVREARARGVHAERADWPAYRGGPFDVVLFGRSLHHVADLDGAVSRAWEVLRPQGRVLVEDFGFTEVGSGTIEGFRKKLRQLEADGGAKITGSDGFAGRILGALDPVEEWHRGADHLHSAERMRKALSQVFVLELESRAPYLYRYLEGLVTPSELERFLRWEVQAIESGSISALGRRFVGRKTARG